jgi:hypothetical protein
VAANFQFAEPENKVQTEPNGMPMKQLPLSKSGEITSRLSGLEGRFCQPSPKGWEKDMTPRRPCRGRSSASSLPGFSLGGIAWEDQSNREVSSLGFHKQQRLMWRAFTSSSGSAN